MNDTKLKIYLAGGWFTPEQDELHTRIANKLNCCIEFDVFNPRKEGEIIKGITTNDKMSKILIGNIEAIQNSDVVVVIYDYKDVGTIWEAGFAYANKKPIIYYSETNGAKPFNLMLAKTGRYSTSIDELLAKLKFDKHEFKNVYNEYSGEIE